MKHASLVNLPFVGPILLLGLMLTFSGHKTGQAQDYESYFLYHGAYPEDEETPYSGEGSNTSPGITHDDRSWFISMTEELWKIPVQYDLRHVNTSGQYPGVIHLLLSDVSPLAQAGNFHIGDLSYYKGYVVAPIEANSPQPHAIVLFRGSDLQYECRAELPGYKDLGWVAVDPICFPEVPYICEEPEGLTLWDLDDGRAPGIAGQLHFVMLDNDGPPDDDDVTLYHYINTLYVDRAYTGNDPATGEPHKPFKTISGANYWVWDGARIKIQAGDYAEAITFSRRIQVLAQGGTVRFGTGGRISLNSSAAINLYSGGALKLSAP